MDLHLEQSCFEYSLHSSTPVNKMNMDFQRQRSELAVMPSYGAITKVAPDASNFGQSIRTLFQWKESIYKLLWKHAIIYYSIYISLTLLYRYGLDDDNKKNFKGIADYCKDHNGAINVGIMLAFFTSEAIKGYLKISMELPGIYTSISMLISTVKTNIPECSTLIATYARWHVLSWVLTFRMICKPLRRVFPDLISIKRAGLLLDCEMQVLKQEEIMDGNYPRGLIVIEWMMHLLREIREKNYFTETKHIVENIECLMHFKKQCGKTIKYSIGNIPKPIIQAVIIAVYTVGILTILGRDLDIDDKKPSDDKSFTDAKAFFVDFFPILPSLQFFVYLSWLSLGRAAVHPFGDDDSDIDITKYVNNHLQSAQRLQNFYDQNFQSLFTKTLDNQRMNSIAEV